MEGLFLIGLWIVLICVIVGGIAFAFIRLRRPDETSPTSTSTPEASSSPMSQELSVLEEVIKKIKERVPEEPSFDTRPLTMPSLQSYRKYDRFILAGKNLDVKFKMSLDDAARACHENPKCTHFEIHPDGATVFKDARMQPVHSMMGFSKWADGVGDGVVMYPHPERMNPVAIRHVYEQLTSKESKMNESKCDGWCITKWIISAFEIACMFIPYVGPLLVFGIEAALFTVDMAVDHFKEQNEKRLDDMMNNPRAEPKTNMSPDIMWMWLLHRMGNKVPGGITGKFVVNDVMGCRKALGTYEYDKVIQSIRKISGGEVPSTVDYAYKYIVDKWEATAPAEYNYSDIQWRYFTWNIDQAGKRESYKDGLFGMVIAETIAAFTPREVEPRTVIDQNWFGYLKAAYLSDVDACSLKEGSETEVKDPEMCVRKACEPVYGIINTMAKRPRIEYT